MISAKDLQDYDYKLNILDGTHLIGKITFWHNKLYPHHLAVGEANIYDDEYKEIALREEGVKVAKKMGLKGIVSDETCRNEIAIKA